MTAAAIFAAAWIVTMCAWYITAVGGKDQRDYLRGRIAALEGSRNYREAILTQLRAESARKDIVIDALAEDSRFHQRQNAWLRRETSTLRETSLPTLVPRANEPDIWDWSEYEGGPA